jgi:hypothetical protein
MPATVGHSLLITGYEVPPERLERLCRDVRTFSLHYRDGQYVVALAQAMLDRSFRGKGYARASTFPESRA